MPAHPESGLLAVQRREGYTVAVLNRPKANALSVDLVRSICAAVEDFGADPAMRCLVITGGEGRFFSGGADIPTIQATLPSPFAEGSLLAEGLRMVDLIENCPKPIVAAVNGIAVGGGCEMILACHLRIASDTAQFGQPEINIGIIPGWGGCHRLPRIVGDGRATEWMLTGRMVSAQEALDAGLVTRVVPQAELMKAAEDLAAKLAKQPPIAVRAILRAVRERALHPDRGRALEAEGFAEAAASQDATEGVAAFIGKRSPRFQGE